jgi:hypothetical protein
MSAVFNIAYKKKKKESEDLSKSFYFISTSPFSVGLYDNSVKSWNDKLEYSLDNNNWTIFEPTTVVSCENGNGGKIFFRGTMNNTLSGDHASDDNDDYAFFKLTGSEVACHGDITALFNYLLFDNSTATTPSTTNYCLYHLFTNCTALVEADFIIPDFIQGEQCCASMFKGCTNLIKAPQLKTKVLKKGCYINMFGACSKLKVAPKLPATVAADFCYYAMFNGCTALTSAPALPAMVLKDHCYTGMFYGCISLVNAPALPATTLASNCYESMFRNCTSLINAPEL